MSYANPVEPVPVAADILEHLHGTWLDRYNAVAFAGFFSIFGVDDELTAFYRPLGLHDSVMNCVADACPLRGRSKLSSLDQCYRL